MASTSSVTDETRSPDSPSTTASWCPAMRVATDGVPQAAASVSVIPQPSRTDVEATTHARRYTSTRSGSVSRPGRENQSAAPAAAIRDSRCGRS